MLSASNANNIYSSIITSIRVGKKTKQLCFPNSQSLSVATTETYFCLSLWLVQALTEYHIYQQLHNL